MKALLGRAQRKNAWGLSQEAGHRAPYAFQHLLLRSKWDADAVRDDVLEYARRALGEGGILAVDETGFLKKGEKSVGVARQYTGTVGKVENVQVGVFRSYVTPRGHALVDRELYLPASWTEDATRRREGGIPEEVCFVRLGGCGSASGNWPLTTVSSTRWSSSLSRYVCSFAA
ncbi:transposase [Myxococcaceae bacterium GXIMD 01537]